MYFSDEILIAWVAQGDRSALEDLYDRHAATILGILLRVIKERAKAEDVLQETFWQVWQNASAYSLQRGPFTSWLFSIARNLAISSGDQGKAHAPEFMEKAKSGFHGIPVSNIVDNLAHKQRQILEMAYFYGMTCQEIALATGEALDTVHALARLGLQNLMEELKTGEVDV